MNRKGWCWTLVVQEGPVEGKMMVEWVLKLEGVAAGISAIQRALVDPGQAPDPYFDLENDFEGDKADWL